METVCSFAHTSSPLQLQYVVHESLADRQLHLFVEHGGWDLHEHATICRMEEGATAVVPNSGDGIPASSFQPKAQMSSFGGSDLSAALHIRA